MIPCIQNSVSHTHLRHARSAGVTLLELLTVMVVIAILAAMLLPAISNMASRMDRAKCTMNLRGLHVAAEFYLQDHKQWPQIDPSLASDHESDEYAKLWMAALVPYKLSKESWHCPTVQKILQGDQPTDPKTPKERIDYYPTPFDSKEITPHLWAEQPWFIERGAVHGAGNLMIFPDGSVKTLDEFLAKVKK